VNRPGRPTKLSSELQEQFCDLLRKGLFRKHAAAKIGVPERTISTWYHRGAREERGKFYAFYLAVDDAEATFAQAGIETLAASQAGDPKVVQWLLSRRFPELYGRKDNVEDQRPEDREAQQQATRTLLMERLERMFPEPSAPTLEPPPTPVATLPEGKPDAVG
jgi:hypothetical protein